MRKNIKRPPKGLAIILLIGPSLVWCSEYIGSGEVILATRNGAILGISVIWAIVTGIFLKFWIGMSGARYTVCTGEGMIDMFSRIPGPKNWAVWIVLIAQFITAAIAIGSIASAGGIFLSSLLPVSSYIGGWIITVSAFLIVWSGEFKILKIIMSLMILIVLIGIFYVTLHVFPDFNDFLKSFIPQKIKVPEWAIKKGVSSNSWSEVLPLIGWGAGGFASQVWYSYWIMGAGYGAAHHSGMGKAADEHDLQNMSVSDARNIKKWCRILYMDASVAMLIGIIVTVAFAIAGAGVLGELNIAPEGEKVAILLSKIFSSRWGRMGGILFMTGGTAALFASQIGQLAGWPRLLADAFRICIPSINRKYSWKIQFRTILLFFFLSNMVIVYSFGYRPVVLVKLGAVLDGLLLTPLQSIWIALGLFIVLPRLVNEKAYRIIKPHWIFLFGLTIAFIVFSYFCIFQIPRIL